MRLNLSLIVVLLSFGHIRAQSDSAVYTLGDLPTEFQAFISTSDESYLCTDTLRVTIPAGNFVNAVDVYYSIDAPPAGNGWVSEQGSYLELTNTSIKEAAVSFGDPNWDSAGVFSYARTGLTDFNGITVSGELDFFLHAFRTFGQFPVCNAGVQRIVNGTWKIVVHHSAPPTCFQPSGLSFTSIGAYNADLIWNSGGSTAWQIEYGPTGFTPGSGTLVQVLTNPYDLTGLLDNTTYDIYVRDSCGPGDLSTWDGPINITTLCGFYTAPWSENFDASPWQTGAGATNAGDLISPCWNRPSAANPNFGVGSGGTPSVGTGPLSGNNGTGNYLYTEASGAQGTGEITSPSVYIPPGLPQPALEFVYHMYGAGIDSLYIEVDNGTGLSQVFSLVGAQQSDNADPWIPVSVPLSSYSGDTVIVRFVGVGNTFAADIAIDDVAIKTVSCTAPSALTVTNPGANSLDISWVSGGAANWQVGYRIANTGSAYTIVNVTTNPFTLTGLQSGTNYEIIVRDSCGAADVSQWYGSQTGLTNCVVEVAPWTENFDSQPWQSGVGAQNTGNQISACWSRPAATNPNFGTRTGPTGSFVNGTGPNADFSGSGNYLFTEASGNPGTGEISSPEVFIPTSVLNPSLVFRTHMFGANIDSLWVEVSANGSAYSQVYSLAGQQQAAQSDPWQLHIVDLNSYSGDTVVVRFSGSNNGFASDISIDEVGIIPITCPEPTNLSFVSSTFNSITVSWVTGGASNWLIGYRVAGSGGAYSIVPAGVNPYTIFGLIPETTYEIVVKDSCAAGDVSLWQGPVNASTKCAPITAPWLETFDGSDWVPGIPNGLNEDNEISDCWSRPSSLGPNFGSWSGPTQSANTGPAGGNSAGGFIYTEASGGATGPGFITSPDIVVPASFANPRLSFYYHMYGAGIDSLIVQVDSGNGFNNSVLILAGQQQTGSNDPWIYFSYDLSSYLGDTIRIRFKGVNSDFTADIAIDDVGVDDAPACPNPTNLNVLSVTGNSIQVGWTSGGAASWQIEYGPPGFTAGTGTLLQVASNPYAITNLSSNTTYDIYVRDSCGSASLSTWSDVVTATTGCGVFSLPFSENFDGSEWQTGGGALNAGMVVSPCWTRPSGANPDFGVGTGLTPSAGTGPSTDVSGGGNYLYTETSGGATGPGSIYTPLILLDSGANTVNLSFSYHMYGVDIDSFYVSVDNGQTVNQIFSLAGPQQSSNTDAWILQRLNLDSYIGDTVRVWFTGVSSDFAGDISIDEILIDTNSCPVPSALSITNVTDNSVALSWTTGGATNWQVEYGPPGFTPGSGTRISLSANPAVVSGLNPSSDYCFFLRDSCGPGSLSDWISVCGTTDCGPVMAPWTEDFNGTSWLTGLGAANNGNQIDPCWKRPSEQNPNFGTWSGPTASANTGPSSDYSGNGKYIYTEASGVTGPGEIQTPRIFIPASMTSPRLEFWYHMYGAAIDSLNVFVDNGAGWVNQFSLAGEQQISTNDPWLKASVDLSAFIGDTIIIQFVSDFNNFQGDVSIDQVSVEDITCPAPTNFQVTGSGGTNISLSWTTGGANRWQIAYRPFGTGAPYSIVSVGANPYVLSGLNPGTTYQIMVRDSCGVGDVSEWVGPILGSTSCAPQGAPWSEDFDTGSWTEGVGAQNVGDEIDPCWIRPSNTGLRWGTGSGTTPSFNTGPQNDFIVNGNYLFIEASNGAGTAIIESPEIFIPTQLLSPRLKYAYHFYGAGIVSFNIEVDNGSGYQSIVSINGQQQTSNLAPWFQDSVSLSAYVDDTIRLRFTGVVNNFQGDMAIDQLAIVGNLQPCLPPTQMSFANINTSSVDLSWPGSSGNAEVEVVLAGQAQGTGLLYPNASSPLSITGLVPGTAYDVYIRELCGSLSSTWLDSTFTTSNCPSVVAGFTSSSNLLAVSFDAQSSVGADSASWDFGDGNSGTGLVISHMYVAPGNYTVLLTTWNFCGNMDTTSLNIQVCDSLLPDFTATVTGDSLHLNATSSIGAAQFYWDFGDGSIGGGVTTSHTYTSPGSKLVQLIAVNLCGDSITITKTIKICLPPVAAWTAKVLGTTANGMQVQFDATASQNASSYEWDFGDGNTLSGQVQPLHTYVTPGLFYTVKLTVTNDCGDSSVKRYRLSEIGVEELPLSAQLSVYPNPATDVIYIEWDARMISDPQVSLYSVDGRMLMSTQGSAEDDGKLGLEVSSLPAGIYSLKVQSGNKTHTQQIIIH